mgnify:CR=1 FL=1
MWKRNCRSLVIILILLIALNIVKAEEIDVSLPQKVKINEEFKIIITLMNFSESIYDAKTDILGNGQRIAQINDGIWKSTYYFIKDVFQDNKAELSLKVIKNFEGNANVIIKIRNSRGITKTFEGYKIEGSGEIKENLENINNEQNTYEESKPEKANEEMIEGNTINRNIESENTSAEISQEFQELPFKEEREAIILAPQNIKNAGNNEIIFKSRNELIKEYSLYGFIFFCIVMVILLLIDRKK